MEQKKLTKKMKFTISNHVGKMEKFLLLGTLLIFLGSVYFVF